MTSKADYLKKYLSKDDDSDKKKKKKKEKAERKFKPIGMRLVEDDAFLSVEAAKARDIGSDEEKEELEVYRESFKKAKVNPGFKKTFATTDEVIVKQEIKEEVLSPDHSPKRKDSSPKRSRQRHDSDNSPPRSGGNRHDSESPPRRQERNRHDSDSSPPRRRETGRQRHDSDNSPPRRRAAERDSSPPRKSRHDSPPARRQRHDSDNSPPRRRNDSSSNRNQRQRHDSDNSPPRKRANERDSSPPRRRRQDDDLSPPRKQRRSRSPDSRKIVQPKVEVDSDDEKVGKMSDGKRSGLQSAKDLKEESDRLREKNAKMYDELDSSVTGRYAETIHRQKQTKRKGKLTEEEQAKKDREEKKTEELKEKYKTWNSGIAQMNERRDRLEEMARVAAEPLARAQDDEAMNAHLKEVLHAADPMAALIHKKRRDTKIDKGEVVYPMYHGSFLPNRFGIPPGHRWDGVDRSNGFEGKISRVANNKAANQSEYYKAIAEYE